MKLLKCKFIQGNVTFLILFMIFILYIFTYVISIIWFNPGMNSLSKISTIETFPKTLKHQIGVILLWTKTYGISQKNIKCGIYKCYITRDRNILSKSHIIVFNARYAKGNTII